MNDLQLNNEQLVMTSKEIAKLTGKAHKHVLADIRVMVEELGIASAEISAHVKTPTNNGGYREIEVYELDKRLTLILVSGYSIQLRTKIIDRWLELEKINLANFVMTTEAMAMLDQVERINSSLIENRNVATTKQVGKAIQDINKLDRNLAKYIPEIVKGVRQLLKEEK